MSEFSNITGVEAEADLTVSDLKDTCPDYWWQFAVIAHAQEWDEETAYNTFMNTVARKNYFSTTDFNESALIIINTFNKAVETEKRATLKGMSKLTEGDFPATLEAVEVICSAGIDFNAQKEFRGSEIRSIHSLSSTLLSIFEEMASMFESWGHLDLGIHDWTEENIDEHAAHLGVTTDDLISALESQQ